LKGGHLRIISAKFGWDWLSSFRGEDFFLIPNFLDFDRLCKLEKRGDGIKNKSSPLQLLSQSQPNFGEMILGCSPFKFVSVSAVNLKGDHPWIISAKFGWDWLSSFREDLF
jgi:hypothetical protein